MKRVKNMQFFLHLVIISSNRMKIISSILEKMADKGQRFINNQNKMQKCYYSLQK